MSATDPKLESSLWNSDPLSSASSYGKASSGSHEVCSLIENGYGSLSCEHDSKQVPSGGGHMHVLLVHPHPLRMDQMVPHSRYLQSAARRREPKGQSVMFFDHVLWPQPEPVEVFLEVCTLHVFLT